MKKPTDSLPQTEKVPVIRLSSREIPQEHQFDAWHHAASPLFDAVPLKDSQSYSCSVTSYLVDQLVFTHTAFDTMQFVRSSQKLSNGESDCISLQYYQTGQLQGTLEDGTPLLMQPDRISLQDFAHSYNGIGGTTNNFGIVIPRHLIAVQDKLYKHYPMFSWAVDSPAGKLLSSALSAMWQQLPYMTRADASAMAAGLIGLLNGLLSTQWDSVTRSQIEQATLKAMKDYLCANLHRSDLGVDQLCQTFYCSRATVYRFFKPLGGVKTYLREQRLNRCYQELQAADPGTGHCVNVIAAKWGFHNPVAFSHLFKRRYSVSPSEVKAIAPANPVQRQNRKASYWVDADHLKGWLESYST